jgi:MFS family permease
METSVRSTATLPITPIASEMEAGEPPEYEALGISTPVAAALEAMRFRDRSTERLCNMASSDWPDFVAWAEVRQVALAISGLCGDMLPPGERALLDRRSAAFISRMSRIRVDLREISSALASEGIAFVVLKGFTHTPDLTPNPLWRAQGDIDIWCRGTNARAAFEVLCNLGYSPVASHSKRHLRPLMREQNWNWDGNLASVPISVEIHEHLWEEGAKYAGAPDETEIWNRADNRTFDADTYRVLRTDDLISFAAFHLFLHLANGDLPLQRAWEIGNFLHTRAGDDSYWASWDSSRSSNCVIELFVFRLVQRWFCCDLPDRVVEASERLPEDALFWLKEFGFEPLRAQSDSNKNYFWLNWCLLRRWRDRFTATRKCFVPIGLPVFVDRLKGTAPESGVNRLRCGRDTFLSRARHHLAALYPTLKGGLIWLGHKFGLEKGFLRFLVSCALLDIGEYVFVILFGFYLLEMGFREDALGLAAAGMSAGMLAGTPLATFIAHRFGLRNAIVIGALGCGLSSLLRIAFTARVSLFLFAFLNGACFSFWAVAFIPAIAGLSRAKQRSFAYGLATSLGISIGIFAGPAATRVPLVLHAAFALGSLDAKRAVLFIGSALMALAALPALSLQIRAPRSEINRPAMARGRFIALFVAGVFSWMLATGSFNAFFTPFFSLQVGLSMVQIGTLFAAGQAVQVIATLAAPLLVRRIGEAKYVAVAVVSTAAMLGLLSRGPGRTATSCLYLGYVAFQYATEPSLFAWIMNRVSPTERTRTSGLLFMTMSIAGVLAAAVSGRFIVQSGYSPVLLTAACLAVLAALFFRWASRQNQGQPLADVLHERNN